MFGSCALTVACRHGIVALLFGRAGIVPALIRNVKRQTRSRGILFAGAGDAILDHARPRGESLSVAHVAIGLGDEAPLSVDGEIDGVDRRRVSVQWFSGTILTGLCGAALMGGAVFAALDGETNFATVPERVEIRAARLARRASASASRRSRASPTGCRPPAKPTSARHVIRVSTTSRVGDREVVRVRPFVRVSSNLALSVSEISANIPPFNPQKIMLGDSDDTPATGEDTAAAEPDAEVSFVTRDLAPLLSRVKIAALGSDRRRDRARARHRRVRRRRAGALRDGCGRASAATALAYAADRPQRSLRRLRDAHRSRKHDDAAEDLATRRGSSGGSNEKVVTVKKGDTVASILRDLGATANDIKSIAAVLGARAKDSALKEGQKLRVLLATIAGKAAAVARDHRRRQRGRCHGRAVRSRPLRAGRCAERRYAGRQRR